MQSCLFLHGKVNIHCQKNKTDTCIYHLSVSASNSLNSNVVQWAVRKCKC